MDGHSSTGYTAWVEHEAVAADMFAAGSNRLFWLGGHRLERAGSFSCGNDFLFFCLFFLGESRGLSFVGVSASMIFTLSFVLAAPGYGHLSNRGLGHGLRFLLCVSVIPVIGEVGPGHGWHAHCRPSRGWRWVTTGMVVLGIGAMVTKVGKGLGHRLGMVDR